MSQYIKTTLAVTNPIPASGGRNGDQVEEIRNNAFNAYRILSRLKLDCRNCFLLYLADYLVKLEICVAMNRKVIHRRE